MVHDEVRKVMWHLLAASDSIPFVDTRAQRFVEEARRYYLDLNLATTGMLSVGGDTLLFTWLGDWVNDALVLMLQSHDLQSENTGVAIVVDKATPQDVADALRLAGAPNGALDTELLVNAQNIERETCCAGTPITKVVLPVSHRENYQIRDARDMFFLDCEARRLTPATRSFYSSKLRPILRWYHAQNLYNVEDVTPHNIRLYLVSLAEQGLASRTQHIHARTIRAFFNYLVRDEVIEHSPFEKVKMPKMEKKIPESFTQEEGRRSSRRAHRIRSRRCASSCLTPACALRSCLR